MPTSPQNTPTTLPIPQVDLLPVYLVVGEDALKRDTVMKRLRARLEAFGDLSFNSDVFNAEHATGADIVTACNTLPFASPVRLVEVRCAERLRKADAEAVISYLEAPSNTTVLALVAEKLAKNTRLYKSVARFGKSAVIDCAPPKRYELPKLVRSMAVSHGVTMSDRSAAKLVELIGEDTVHLDAEVKKLALAHQGTDAVSVQEVENLVARTAEVKPWEFVNAFSARDTRTCINFLDQMNSASPHALLALCVNRLRELVCARAMIERGTPQKLSSILKMPDWRLKNHLSWAREFTDEQLRNALVSACATEQAMKSGSDPTSEFLDWVLAVTAHK